MVTPRIPLTGELFQGGGGVIDDDLLHGIVTDVSEAAGVVTVSYLDANGAAQTKTFSATGSTSGLTQPQVDARINALRSIAFIDGRVQAYKATNSPRTPAPLPAANAANALTGGWDASESNWADAGHIHALTEHQAAVFNALKGGEWNSRAEMLVTQGAYTSAPTLANLTTDNPSWVVASTGGDGSRRENQFWGFRIPKTLEGEPVALDDVYRFWRAYIVIDDADDFRQRFAEENYVGDSTNYHLFAQQFADKPAGDSVYVQSREPYTVDDEILDVLADGAVTPPKLAGALPNGAVVKVNADGSAFIAAPGQAHITTPLDSERIEHAITDTSRTAGFRSPTLRVGTYDTDDTPHAIAAVDTVWHITTEGGVGDTSLTFGENPPNEPGNAETSAFTTSTSIANTIAFANANPATTVQGVAVGSVEIWRGSTRSGVATLYLTRDGQNAVSAYWTYIGEAGNYSLTLRATVTVTLIPNDAAAAGGSPAPTTETLLDLDLTSELAAATSQILSLTTVPRALTAADDDKTLSIVIDYSTAGGAAATGIWTASMPASVWRGMALNTITGAAVIGGDAILDGLPAIFVQDNTGFGQSRGKIFRCAAGTLRIAYGNRAVNSVVPAGAIGIRAHAQVRPLAIKMTLK